ncbi:MAG: hypothetical protein FD174_2422 [Geobacteraceae bacterium]|nr:MAG: hypothetical protein FD174_2422 [Geobacteraceae bacterium]
MLTEALKSEKLTIVLFLLLLALFVMEGETQKVSGYAFLGLAAPLVLNLLFCVFHHIKRTKTWDMAQAGFILFHVAFLIIIAGGITTYLTYSIGYAEVVEGGSFTDSRESYAGWKQRFGTRSGTGINVAVRKIHLDFWENGQIREYFNNIVIRDGIKDQEATVNVNGSVKYGSLLINLARYYGLAPHFRLTTPDATNSGYVYISSTAKTNNFAIPLVNYKAQVSYRDLTDRRVRIRVRLNELDSIERVMRIGDSIDLGAGKLTLTDIKIWNGLTVVTDSGKWITYAGFSLFLLGLAIYYGTKFFWSGK